MGFGVGRIGSLLVAAVAALILVRPAPCSAQTDRERAGARAAAEAGATAFDAGRYDQAVDLFTRAESLVHAPPHLLYIARASAKLGQLVKAKEAYLKLVREELGSRAPPAFVRAKEQGEQELLTVEQRLAYVSIVVQGAPADAIRVVMDGESVPAALLGVPQPWDPGEHHVQAFAQGKESARTAVNLKEGAKETVVLTLHSVGTESPTSAGSAAAPADAAPGRAPAPPATDAGSGIHPVRIGAYVAMGLGAVGLGIGTVFIIQKSSTNDRSDDLFQDCDPGCSTADRNEIQSLDDEANSQGRVGTIGLVSGGVLLATGVVLFVLSPSADGPKVVAAGSLPPVLPWVSPSSAGISGTF